MLLFGDLVWSGKSYFPEKSESVDLFSPPFEMVLIGRSFFSEKSVSIDLFAPSLEIGLEWTICPTRDIHLSDQMDDSKESSTCTT